LGNLLFWTVFLNYGVLPNFPDRYYLPSKVLFLEKWVWLHFGRLFTSSSGHPALDREHQVPLRLDWLAIAIVNQILSEIVDAAIGIAMKQDFGGRRK
jgi:hypothetical protein